MTKVCFLTFYIDYSVGVYILSSILQKAGYDVSNIFFKLPKSATIEWFKDNPNNMEEINRYGDIIGYNVDVNKWTETEVSLLINQINELSPDILCISSRSTHNELVADILPEIKKRCKTTMIAGGMGPTLEPERYLDLVDYVYLGEAENSIIEIILALEKGKSLINENNICYKKNGQIIKNKLRIPDINLLGFQEIPEKCFYIDNNKIYNFENRSEILKTHSYSTFFGRGCISSCSYCSAGQWRSIYKKENINIKKRRNRSIEDIIEELKRAKQENYSFIHFRDEFLCADTKTLNHFFTLYKKEICLPFWAYLVPAQMLENPETLKIAVNAGFVDTEIGFQSGSDRINRAIFSRRISNKTTMEYAKLLSKYNINMKYDFIVFNPAETKDDISITIKLIQSLPKKRSYLSLCRLFYFPVSPIVNILKDYEHIQHSASYYYSISLIYLLSFLLPENELNKILKDEKMVSSHSFLKEKYKSFLKDNKVDFMIGTHNIPDSITTHRYKRILDNKKYKEVIVWANGNYFNELSDIFSNTNIIHLINDDREEIGTMNTNFSSPDILNNVQKPIPIFICSKDKQKVLNIISKDYPDYKGRVYV